MRFTGNNTVKYLFNENPLVIDRELAVVIGLNEAMILQQMHYWIRKSEHNIDGKTWIYNSISQWREQFPFWSESTINRTIKNLNEQGLLFIGNYNRDRRDRTKWYSIDYESLDRVVKNAFSQNDICNLSDCTDATDSTNATSQIDKCNSSNCKNAFSQNDQMQQVNLTKPLPEITTEITTENNNKKTNKKNSFDPISVKPKNVSREIWVSWIEYKNAKKQKLLPKSWVAQSKMLESQPDAEAVINQSIMNGWAGLFPCKSSTTSNKTTMTTSNFKNLDYGETTVPTWFNEVSQ